MRTTSDATAGPDLARQLEELAVDLAVGAADVVRGWTSRRYAVSSKSGATDLVTEADRACEQWLLDRLAVLRPDDSVLGEEGARRDGTSGVRWVLDPIDGTVNFILGLPQYAVSVAAQVRGAVVAGAVCNPVSAEVFHASLGGGAFLDGRRLDGPRNVPLARAVVGTGFAYDPVLRARQAVVVAGLLPLVADIRRLGAASLDLCAVAAGRLDAYFEVGLNEWDYAAGLLIAAEAGCATLWPGRSEPVLSAATGSALSDELFAVLAVLGAGVLSN